MADTPQTASIPPDALPRLPRGVRLVHNEAQGGWVLLAPERVFKADAIAYEILKRCTGEATFAQIVVGPDNPHPHFFEQEVEERIV